MTTPIRGLTTVVFVAFAPALFLLANALAMLTILLGAAFVFEDVSGFRLTVLYAISFFAGSFASSWLLLLFSSRCIGDVLPACLGSIGALGLLCFRCLVDSPDGLFLSAFAIGGAISALIAYLVRSVSSADDTPAAGGPPGNTNPD